MSIDEFREWTAESLVLDPDIDRVFREIDYNQSRSIFDDLFRRNIPILDLAKGKRIVRAWHKNRGKSDHYPLYFDATNNTDAETKILDLTSGINAGIVGALRIGGSDIEDFSVGLQVAVEEIGILSIARVADIHDIPQCAYVNLRERLSRPLASLVITNQL